MAWDEGERVTVFTSDRISVWCVPSRRLIQHEMHRTVYGLQLHDALLAGIEAMSKHGATKWLSDDRRNSPLPPEDLAWGDEVWFPKAQKAGWKHWALVQPESVIGQLNMRRFTKMYGDRGINVAVFSDVQPALAWIDPL